MMENKNKIAFLKFRHSGTNKILAYYDPMRQF